MKKLLIPTILSLALLTASCGKKADKSPSPSPSVSPRATASATSPSPTSGNTDNPDANGTTAAPEQTSGSGYTVDGDDSTTNAPDNSNSSSSGHSDSVSIINSSSITFYAVYLSASSNGNPGENIIGDTPLGEGEEIVLPFANAPDMLTIIVEDENGIQYSAGGVSLANGMTIELRLNGGTLEAIVQ